MLNKKETQTAIRDIIRIYEQTRDTTPQNTAKNIIDELGTAKAREAMAVLIKNCSYDGRISPQSKDYWTAVPSWEKAENEWLGVSEVDKIHRAHLNQIAEAMSKICSVKFTEKELQSFKDEGVLDKTNGVKVIVEFTNGHRVPYFYENFEEPTFDGQPGNGLQRAIQHMEKDRGVVSYNIEGVQYVKLKAYSEKSDGVEIEGHYGTWHCIDSCEMQSHNIENATEKYFLMEHDEYGEDAALVIVNRDGSFRLDDVWNGFEDLEDYFAAKELLSDGEAEDCEMEL